MITDGEEALQKMKRIISKYNKLYKAIEGYVQYDKMKYYCQKWERINRKLIIKDEEIGL